MKKEQELREKVEALTRMLERSSNYVQRESLEERIRTTRIELDFQRENREQRKQNKAPSSLKRKVSCLEASEAPEPPTRKQRLALSREPSSLEASEGSKPPTRRQRWALEARAEADSWLQKAKDARRKVEESRCHEDRVRATTTTIGLERQAAINRSLEAEDAAQKLEERASRAVIKAEKKEADARKAESIAAARLSNNSAEQSLSSLANQLPSSQPLTDSPLLPLDSFEANERIPAFLGDANSSLSQLLLAETASWQAGNDSLEDTQESSRVEYQGAVDIAADRGFEHTDNGDETEANCNSSLADSGDVREIWIVVVTRFSGKPRDLAGRRDRLYEAFKLYQPDLFAGSTQPRRLDLVMDETPSAKAVTRCVHKHQESLMELSSAAPGRVNVVATALDGYTTEHMTLRWILNHYRQHEWTMHLVVPVNHKRDDVCSLLNCPIGPVRWANWTFKTLLETAQQMRDGQATEDERARQLLVFWTMISTAKSALTSTTKETRGSDISEIQHYREICPVGKRNTFELLDSAATLGHGPDPRHGDGGHQKPLPCRRPRVHFCPVSWCRHNRTGFVCNDTFTNHMRQWHPEVVLSSLSTAE